MAGCEGAAARVAATRPMARVRARAAALKLALLFILLTPNRNDGHLVATGYAHDRTGRSGRRRSPIRRPRTAIVRGWLRTRSRHPPANRDPEARHVAARG